MTYTKKYYLTALFVAPMHVALMATSTLPFYAMLALGFTTLIGTVTMGLFLGLRSTEK